MLELTMDPTLITAVNAAKWGTMLNYSYIPADAQDAKRHRELLAQYGVSDAKAYMSQFYPQIKREITCYCYSPLSSGRRHQLSRGCWTDCPEEPL